MTSNNQCTAEPITVSRKCWIRGIIIAFDVKPTHSTVRGDKLLYGHVPDPSVWPRKTNIYQHLTHMVVQVPGISASNDQCTTGLIYPTVQYSSHDT